MLPPLVPVPGVPLSEGGLIDWPGVGAAGPTPLGIELPVPVVPAPPGDPAAPAPAPPPAPPPCASAAVLRASAVTKTNDADFLLDIPVSMRGYPLDGRKHRAGRLFLENGAPALWERRSGSERYQ
jgi:hypothetical protein